MTIRTAVVWCPDWPVSASGLEGPVVVVKAGRVVVASRLARRNGVRTGQRRRQAESLCAGLQVIPHDEDGDARAFESVAQAVSSFCPTVEVMRPGLCAFAARGPARYFGGEEALCRQVASVVDAVLPPGAEPCRVGVADGPFAATLAARRDLIVPAGETAGFLAPLSVRELGRAELADLLGRLGIRTLGQLAALPAPQVLSRFGWEGAQAHRLARGQDERPLDARRPPADLSVEEELDPPVERVDMAAFAAKVLADRLYEALARGGWRCTLVRIEAESEHGETLSRSWRHDGSFTAATLAERVRWQMDGWLMSADRPTGGLTRLRLSPEEVTADQGTQQGFWGGVAEADTRAARVLGRVQALLGPEGVLTAVLEGGRSPQECFRFLPWGDERSPRRAPDQPWPGQIPPPWPARVLGGTGWPVELMDSAGVPVLVRRRGTLRAGPAWCDFGGTRWKVAAWSSPWPCLERWWDPQQSRRRARLQVLLEDGRALLLGSEQGAWSIEAVYD